MCDPARSLGSADRAPLGVSFLAAAYDHSIDPVQGFAEARKKPVGDVLEGRDLETGYIVEIFVVDPAADVLDGFFDVVQVVRPAVNRIRLSLQVDADREGMAMQTGIWRRLMRRFERELFECFEHDLADEQPPPCE